MRGMKLSVQKEGDSLYWELLLEFQFCALCDAVIDTLIHQKEGQRENDFPSIESFSRRSGTVTKLKAYFSRRLFLGREYPEIYRRAQAIEEFRSLPRGTIHDKLALDLYRSHVLDRDHELSATFEKNSVQEFLSSVELFAKSFDPERYPAGHQLWHRKSSPFARKLKFHFFHEILNRAEEMLSQLGEDQASLLPLAREQKENRRWSQVGEDYASQNRWLMRLAPSDAAVLKEVYRSIDGQPSSERALWRLSSSVHELGFSGGVVFLFRDHDVPFVPILSFGESTRKKAEALGYRSQPDLLDGLIRRTPMRLEGVGLDTSIRSFLTAELGSFRLAGVLYLEIGEDRVNDPEFDSLTHFQAIRHTIVDCFEVPAQQ